MAMLPSNKPTSFVQPTQQQGRRCRGCGYPIKSGDRFCDNCGLDVL
jgi:predicted amidophosphoribosyltransferase